MDEESAVVSLQLARVDVGLSECDLGVIRVALDEDRQRRQEAQVEGPQRVLSLLGDLEAGRRRLIRPLYRHLLEQTTGQLVVEERSLYLVDGHRQSRLQASLRFPTSDEQHNFTGGSCDERFCIATITY